MRGMISGDQTSRRKRNVKCWGYIVAGVIALAIIASLIVVLLVKMRIRNPKVRLESAIVENLRLDSSPSDKPSFTMKLNAQVTVNNTNLGHLEFKNSTFMVSYQGYLVGKATIVRSRACRARSIEKFNVTISISSNDKILSGNSEQLSSDIESGIINLSCHGKLEGKIYIFNILKKKKSAEMNCSMDVNTLLKQIQNLTCK